VSASKHAVPAVSAAAAAAVTAAAVPAALAGTVAPAIPAGHMTRAVLDVEVVRQMAAPRPLVTRIVHDSARKSYMIASGDTLSGIAGRFCGSARKWPSLFAGNRAEIKDPDLIFPGQKLRLTCAELAAAVQAQADPPPVRHDPFDGHHGNCGDGDGDGMDAPCSVIFPGSSRQAPAQAAPQRATAAVTGASGTVGGGWPGGAFGNCVVQRESGGNSQVMNSSGHYGLYQFSAGTWAAYGGNPADFGRASVAEQEQVFMTALSQGGQSNWSPYDGC
jgi:LysM repeat protein